MLHLHPLRMSVLCQQMKHLIDHLTGRLLGYVNVHSGEWALYTPWDSKEAYGPGLPVGLQLRVLVTLAHRPANAQHEDVLAAVQQLHKNSIGADAADGLTGCWLPAVTPLQQEALVVVDCLLQFYHACQAHPLSLILNVLLTTLLAVALLLLLSMLITTQADLPDLVGKVGRLCDCKAGPAGAVSGYLAYGTSMDYLYVHKRVPYPLTVEVYGGGNIGKLGAGERNQELTAWPTVTKSGAPTTAAAQFQRRLLQQQQQQQEGERDLAGRSWTGWLRRLLQAPAAGEDAAAANAGQQAAAVEQPPLLPQQQHGQRRRHRRRRRHRQQRLTKPGLLPDITAAAGGAAAGAGVAAAEAEPSSSTDASTGAATATPEPVVAAASLAAAAAGEVPAGLAGGLAPAAGSGFSAGGVGLEQLRQQAKQQLLQQPIRGRTAPASLSIANEPLPSDQLQQQQGGEGGQEQDAILSMVTAAAPHQRSCFDAFNPVTEPEYRRVVADWLAASLIMMKHMVAGEEGQKMIAQVAAGAGQGQHGRVGSKGQQASGISVREPVGTNSSAAFLGGH